MKRKTGILVLAVLGCIAAPGCNGGGGEDDAVTDADVDGADDTDAVEDPAADEVEEDAAIDEVEAARWKLVPPRHAHLSELDQAAEPGLLDFGSRNLEHGGRNVEAQDPRPLSGRHDGQGSRARADLEDMHAPADVVFNDATPDFTHPSKAQPVDPPVVALRLRLENLHVDVAQQDPAPSLPVLCAFTTLPVNRSRRPARGLKSSWRWPRGGGSAPQKDAPTMV
jgi:hypothetical protein